MKALYTLLLALLLVSSTAFSQQENHLITFPSTHFQVDLNSRMIVCNDDLGKYASLSQSATINLKIGDDIYILNDKIEKFELGVVYNLKKSGESFKLYFTGLPLISISTETEIVDEPKIAGDFFFSESSGYTFSSKMGIEIRGGLSQIFPKKSYDIEFWADQTGNEKVNTSFMGMRSDDDWLLLAMYSESLKINNVTSHELWQQLHSLYYADKEAKAKATIQTHYVELFVNHEYRGIYALAEQLDSKQLQLKDIKDSTRGELYKGTHWDDVNTFRGLSDFDNNSLFWGGYEYKFPEGKVDWTNMFNFTSFVLNSSEEEFKTKFSQHFEIPNAIDYYIFLNLTKALDNRGKNIYMAKYEANSPYFYVPWDLDGTWGYTYSGEKDNSTTDILYNDLFDRLLKSNPENFREQLKSRWFSLREHVLAVENLKAMFKGNYDKLYKNGAYLRDNEKWTEFISSEDELTYLLSWIEDRVIYLDNYFTNVTEAVYQPYQDKTAPIAKFNFIGSSNPFETNFIPTLTFNEPVRLIDNTLLNSGLIRNIVDLRVGNVTGEHVPYSAIITDNNTITITPQKKLAGGKTYYLALKENVVEDFSDNAYNQTYSGVFNTVQEQILGPGDILLTAYRMSTMDVGDEISFVTLVDLAPGVAINFTDSKYTTNAQPQCAGSIVWTAPAEGLQAGSSVRMSTSVLSCSTGSVSGSTFGLSSNGDQIIVYTGTASDPVFITALSSNAWVASNTKCGGSISKLPAALADGQTSINLSSALGNTAGNTVNAYYNGTQESSQTGLRLAILNPANWVGIGADTPAQQWPDWAFRVNPLNVKTKISKDSFIVFPNPVQGSTLFFSRVADVTIYNSLGQVIENASNTDKLDISNYKKGVYFIKTKEGINRTVIVR